MDKLSNEAKKLNKTNKISNKFLIPRILLSICLALNLIAVAVLIYLLYSKIFTSIAILIVASVLAVILIAVINIVSSKEKIFLKNEEIFRRKKRLKEKRERERKEKELQPRYLDLDTLEIHSDLKRLIITNRNIKDFIPPENSIYSYIGTEPSLIDEYLPVNLEIDPDKEVVRKIPASASNISYEKMSPNQRGMYLRFLKNPYDEEVDIGYVMTLFFGLERHLVYGEAALAGEVMENLRGLYRDKRFSAFSFNALVYAGKGNGGFLDFLRREYYSLDLNFTIYYHLKTDKIFPTEAMIRFRSFFHFPNDAREINPIVFRNEIESLFGRKFGEDDNIGYSLERYARGSIPRLESLPFPANPSMDKVVSKYISGKNLYQLEPFNTDISDLLKRAYMNIVSRNAF